MKIDALIVAGGRGTRMGYEKNKVFMPVLGCEMLVYTIKAFSENKYIRNIILVTGKEDVAVCKALIKAHGLFKIKCVVEGGNLRQNSVYNGLMHTDSEFVCIHDGARALITDKIISETIENAIKYNASAPAVKCKDTLKTIDDDGFIVNTVDRDKTVLIQTPQVFKTDDIKMCHEKALKENIVVTDDCALAEKYGINIKITEGSYENIKLTTPEDVVFAEKILGLRRKK